MRRLHTLITQSFKDSIENKNMQLTKIMLKNSLFTDLTFDTFKEMLDYTLSVNNEIIEKHDEKKFLDSSSWSKDYASDLREDLIENFSAERIAHIQQVHQYIYKEELENQLNTTATYHDEKSFKSGINIPTLIATLGVATASILIGVLLDMSIVQVATTSTIAAMTVGGITYYLIKKQK